MLIGAAILLAAAGALGTFLAARQAGGTPGKLPWWIGALHGVLGLAGGVLLLFALQAPPRGIRHGVEGFGVDAVALFNIAALTGGALLVLRARHRPLPGLLIGLHATFAIMGLVVLAAFL